MVSPDDGGIVEIDSVPHTSYPVSNMYLSGESVSLKAVPSPGYRFVNWIGTSTGDSESIAIEMTCTKDVTAVFIRIAYPLATDIAPGESGTIVLEPAQPDEGYSMDTEVTIAAIPDKGYRFSHWSGAVSGSENPVTIIMDSGKQLNANFTEVPLLQRIWWWIVIGVAVIGSLVYFLVIRPLTSR